jgi:DNA-binding MarR family transcriptional regulator
MIARRKKACNMSFVHTHNVFLNSDLTKGQKLVLAVISTFTNQAGKCRQSNADIAARCSLSERALQRHIADLVKLGYLTRIYRTGETAITQIHSSPKSGEAS